MSSPSNSTARLSVYPAANEAEQSGLSAARGSQNRGELSFRYFQVDAPQDLDAPITGVERFREGG